MRHQYFHGLTQITDNELINQKLHTKNPLLSILTDPRTPCIITSETSYSTYAVNGGLLSGKDFMKSYIFQKDAVVALFYPFPHLPKPMNPDHQSFLFRFAGNYLPESTNSAIDNPAISKLTYKGSYDDIIASIGWIVLNYDSPTNRNGYSFTDIITETRDRHHSITSEIAEKLKEYRY
ncbi:MAG: hypothetical protein ACOCUT_00450 [bacterium]